MGAPNPDPSDDDLLTHRGHDPHFLERLCRVSLPHMDLALSLYRDPQLIRFIPLSAIPWVARSEPENCYFPAAIAEQVTPRWTRAHSVAILGQHQAIYGASRPARAAVTPGRSDPCSCKSGRKYKKCCGAPGANSGSTDLG